MLKSRIIDSHMHIGNDYFWDIEGDIEQYISIATKRGITESLVMSVPCPVIRIGDYKVSSIFAGIYGNGSDDWEMVQEITGNDGEYDLIPPQQNPYQMTNLTTSMTVLKNQEKGIKLHFVPLVHPCLDTYEYWEFVANWFEPVAIKVHGLSAILHPKDIPNDFWMFIEEYKIPLIIHTDVYRGDNLRDITNIYRNYNTPLEWLKVLQHYEVRAYLAHGARLCKESIKIINENSNFIVGLGPDSRLATQQDQLYSDEPYLKKLFEMISLDKVCFDSDYPYNTFGNSDRILEWDSINRIRALGLTEDELAKVLYINSSKFFNI